MDLDTMTIHVNYSPLSNQSYVVAIDDDSGEALDNIHHASKREVEMFIRDMKDIDLANSLDKEENRQLDIED